MVKTYSLPGGGPGLFQSLVRSALLLIAAIGGVFVFAASAALALIVAAGLLIFGVVVFVAFWLRAKITGRRMMPKMQPFMGAQSFQTYQEESTTTSVDKGPVIDAHETPDGWSVDED